MPSRRGVDHVERPARRGMLSHLSPDRLLFAHDRLWDRHLGAGLQTTSGTREQFGAPIQALVGTGLERS
jgi:hypothetical protein